MSDGIVVIVGGALSGLPDPLVDAAHLLLGVLTGNVQRLLFLWLFPIGAPHILEYRFFRLLLFLRLLRFYVEVVPLLFPLLGCSL